MADVVERLDDDRLENQERGNDMTEFERIEKRFKQLKDFLTERQAEDPDADRHDEGDGYNIARVDLHEIKLAFFALAQERDRLKEEIITGKIYREALKVISLSSYDEPFSAEFASDILKNNESESSI